MAEADPTRRFSHRAADYARARPGYPPAVLAELERSIGFEPAWIVADIGSGTGISTRMFLDAGCRVHAVEPNAAMRAEAERTLGAASHFHSVAGSASATGLEPSSVDLIVAAQALHWFDARAVVPEFARIARPNGRLCVLWNERRTAGSAFASGYEDLLARRGTDYGQVLARNLTPERVAPYFAGAHFHHVTLPYSQALDLAGIQSRLLSSSYVPLAGEPGHEALLAELGELFARNQRDGTVEIAYDSHVYCGALAR
ncbi:MAG: class I SAM-dependent methyltransferase [Planctomycetota bacterium]